jgi:hypothetical protein
MEQYGNTTTFNLETVLRENIIRSQYWEKTCIDLEGWQEVVDEIYYRWGGRAKRLTDTCACPLWKVTDLFLAKPHHDSLNHNKSKQMVPSCALPNRPCSHSLVPAIVSAAWSTASHGCLATRAGPPQRSA